MRIAADPGDTAGVLVMDYSQPGPRLGTQAALEFANEVNELLEEDELANQEVSPCSLFMSLCGNEISKSCQQIGYMTRDNILFCIDGSTTMQRPLADSAAGKLKFDPEDVDADGNPLDTAGKGKSPLQLALESVLSVMRTKIMSGPTDYVGVLVYNVVVGAFNLSQKTPFRRSCLMFRDETICRRKTMRREPYWSKCRV